jgi:hypothetical protein
MHGATKNERHVICTDNGLIGLEVLNDHGNHHWHGHWLEQATTFKIFTILVEAVFFGIFDNG